jgi:cell division protein FtsQ
MLSQAEQGAVRDVVSRSLKHGILSLDVADLGRRIRELSWPRSVAVRRVWPDALVIKVEKESVVAAWGDGGYLTSAGKIVRLADGAHDVPELVTSLTAPRRAMEVYQMFESRVNAAGFSIVRLEENPLGEWLMTFDSGTTVALGNEALTERLERFLFAYRRALAQHEGELAHVDLRYDNGLAVRWTDGPGRTDAHARADAHARTDAHGRTDAHVGAISRSRMPGSEDIQDSRSGDRSYEVPGRAYALRR